MSVNQSLGPPDEWKLKITMRPTAEQQLRDAMEAMGFPEAQSWSSGDCMAAAIAASGKGRPQQPAPDVTDAMAEVALKTFWQNLAPNDGLAQYIPAMRAALAAALGVTR